MAKGKKTKPADAGRDYILVDRSGSMAGRWSDTIGGVNAYAQGLARDSATKGVRLTVATFDMNGGVRCTFDILRDSVVADQWNDIGVNECSPRGGTPLFDAVGRLVALADKDAPAKAAIVIVTDGEENSSVELNRERAKQLLDRCRDKGWQIIFLGADFDNSAQGASLGNAVHSTVSAEAAQMNCALAETGAMRAKYTKTGASMTYSAEQRRRFAPSLGK